MEASAGDKPGAETVDRQPGASCLLGFFMLLKVDKPKALRAASAVHHDFDTERFPCKRKGKYASEEGSSPCSGATKSPARTADSRGSAAEPGGRADSGTRAARQERGLRMSVRAIPPTRDAALIALGFWFLQPGHSAPLARSSHHHHM